MPNTEPTPENHLDQRQLTGPEQQQHPVAVVIDSLQLRRCCVTQAFSDWLARQDISVQSMPLSALRTDIPLSVPCDLIILNTGALPIADVADRGILRQIRACFGSKPVLILSDRDNAEDARDAFLHDAQGFISSDTKREVALNAFMFILHGGTYFPPSALLANGGGAMRRVERQSHVALQASVDVTEPSEDANNLAADVAVGTFTARQIDVLPLLQEGLPNKVIALHLGMTEATVKVHVRQIMRKLGASNRTQAVVRLSSLKFNASDTVCTYSTQEKIGPYRSRALNR